MMRYQRVSPDVLPLGNGRKPIVRTSKEDDADHSSRNANHSPSEGKSTRARSVSVSAGPSPSRDHQFPRIPAPFDSPTSAAATHSERQPPPSASPKSQSRQHHDAVNSVGSDVILQWGHNKRSRRPRASGDETSAHSRQLLKIPRRSPASSSAAMPPPPCGGSCARAGHLRTSVPVGDAKKGVEDQSGGPARSEKRSPPAPPDKALRAPADAPVNPSEPKQPPADQESAPVAIAEKLSLDRLEWPKIYLSLSRKEKEDDFLAMKGTKLPQRPKKRAKNIDRTLQYCFPGMWLSDLTRGRYEVREKKCAKKRRRGLKGMESVDSDSE
ncbi:hypothetical protein C4D60_Mb08t27670 [Musa balbisiana]|uniref:DUF1639 family protein n=1 Tax=Musa balbisiana TaxID=52838 RepID=A0A4S8K6Z0_MUSBA|nr:hypothetical protein C4D60_Mb08t27670 [Musa balbisiana]